MRIQRAGYSKNRLFITLMFIGLSAFSVSSFLNELDDLKQQTKLVVERRAELITQHMNLLSAGTQALQNALEKANHPAEQNVNEHILLKELQFYPQYDVYSLPPSDNKPQSPQLSGILHILARQEVQNPKLQTEIAATLSIDPIFKALIDKVDTITWVYYTSKQGFLFIAPKNTLANFKFNTEQFQKPFWQQVTPENNYLLKPIITPIYKDGAGQGMVITLSNPVVVEGEFLGAVSIDVSTDDLNQLIAINPAFKSSILIDENKIITASQDVSLLGKPLIAQSFNTQGKCLKEANGWLFSSPVVENELFLIHSVSHSELLIQAAKNSMSLWILSLFGLLLTTVTLQLSRSLEANKTLMLIDPLTNLYNRRGFVKLTDPTIAHIKRTNQSWAALIIDLDFFKKVNDRYGHAAGDSVLTSVADILKGYNRDESIVCRWGGEEFLIFIPYATQNSAEEVAERIRQKVIDNLHINTGIAITCSIGVAMREQEDDIEITIKHADRALYQAKENGRNQSVFYVAKQVKTSSVENLTQAL